MPFALAASSLSSQRFGATNAVDAQFRSHPVVFLSTATAEKRQRRLALAVIALSSLGFVCAIPFARVPLTPVSAFIPAYEAALLLIDLLTAVLLMGQYAQERSPALLVLSAAYLFDVLMVVPHALSFPGLISPSGWLGAGSQTTAWLYMFWHGGFPLFVVGYACLKPLAEPGQRSAHFGWVLTVGATVALALTLTLLAVHADTALPQIMVGNGYTAAIKFVVGTVWLLTLLAVAALLRNRPYTVLDLWLTVVMVAWFFDIALSAVLNAGRFDLGFYAGRLYGLLATSFVLGVILLETIGLHRQLAELNGQLHEYAQDLDLRVRERTGELLRINSRISAILEASPVVIYMLDRDGRVVFWTSSAERLFGYTSEEAVGGPPPYLDDNELAVFRGAFARTVAEASSGFNEAQRRNRDGTIIDVSVTWAPVHDEDGALLGIMYAIADVTERRKLEGQLRQAQRMEAIGQLTGGMAHDFNNLLGVIIGNLDLLRESGANASEAAELTSEALDAALRGADLTRRLLAFARRQPLQPKRLDINALIASTANLLRRTLGGTVEISLQLADELWPVTVDPAQLEASLINLANNARDAMPKGGRLTIVTANRYLDADYASQHVELPPGEYAMIVVTDTGTGMAPEVASRIFEPFYTTKEQGKGTGLGLSMVFGFMKQSGGHINLYSEMGVGTTFRLYLPRGGAEAEAISAAQSIAPPLYGNGETILAVDDAQNLRRVVGRQLTELGYHVIEAEDAHAALNVLERERVDLLFTDVAMPGGTSGFELARIASERYPGIKVVLTSGFPDLKPGEGEALSELKLLNKPYRRDELARTVREALSKA